MLLGRRLWLPELMNKLIRNSKRCQYKKLLLKHCSVNSKVHMNRWTYLTVFNNIRSAQQTSRVGGAGFRAGHLGQRTRRGEGAARQTLGASTHVRRSRQVSEARHCRVAGAQGLCASKRLCPWAGRPRCHHHWATAGIRRHRTVS